MKRPSPVLLGILIGLAFTLVLNAANLCAWSMQQLTVADLGADIGSADEVYYFALIRDVRDGHMNLGNASLFEYRDAPAVAGFALLPQGMIARFTSLELATVILFGDVLFPLLICCLAFLLVRKYVASDVFAGILALSFMAWWGTGWLRSMHPQVTMTVFLLSLLLFVSDTDGKKMYQRGVSLFILLLVQPIFAAYILTAEGVDALVHAKRTKSLVAVLRVRWPLVVYVSAAAVLHVGLQRGADAEVLAQTYQRRGLILSHLPAAPQTQFLLLIFLGISIWIIRRKRMTDSFSRLIPVLLIAGLIVLNQSLLHGRDAVFGLYYRLPLMFILWLTAAWAVSRILPRRLAPILAVLVLAFTGRHMWQEMRITVPRDAARSQNFQRSDLPTVMQKLATHAKTEIVLAPIELSNLVPVFTQHYTLFTQYARFEYAPDRELAERYLLLRSFFPLSSEQTLEGNPLVFGIFAGNVYARTKILCRMHLTNVGCDKNLSDFIPDQTVRQFIDNRVIDQIALLRKFGVTRVVTDKALPQILQSFCKDPVPVGSYRIYSCSFKDETVRGSESSAL